MVFILDDDGNINPYATFKEMKQVLRDTEPSEMDDISLEKAEAQRAVSLCRMIRFKSIMYFNLLIALLEYSVIHLVCRVHTFKLLEYSIIHLVCRVHTFKQ